MVNEDQPGVSRDPVVVTAMHDQALLRSPQMFREQVAPAPEGSDISLGAAYLAVEALVPDRVTIFGPDDRIDVVREQGSGRSTLEFSATSPYYNNGRTVMTTPVDVATAAAIIGVDAEQLAPVVESSANALGSTRAWVDTQIVEGQGVRSGSGLDPSVTAGPSYREVMAMPLAQAAQMGVSGTDLQANTARAERAQAVLSEHEQIRDKAYRSASPFDEPDIVAPMVARVVADADGDLAVAAQDPRIVFAARDSLELRPVHITTYNEDDEPTGQKYYDPLQQDPEAIGQLTQAVNDLRGSVGATDVTDGQVRGALATANDANAPRVRGIDPAASLDAVGAGHDDRSGSRYQSTPHRQLEAPF